MSKAGERLIKAAKELRESMARGTLERPWPWVHYCQCGLCEAYREDLAEQQTEQPKAR